MQAIPYISNYVSNYLHAHTHGLSLGQDRQSQLFFAQLSYSGSLQLNVVVCVPPAHLPGLAPALEYTFGPERGVGVARAVVYEPTKAVAPHVAGSAH